MSVISLKIIFKKKGNSKNIDVPIYLRFTKNRKSNYISLKKSVPIKCWDGTKKYVHERGTHAHPNGRLLNNYLNSKYNEAEAIILSNDEHLLTFEQFKNIFLGNRVGGHSFFEMYDELLGEKMMRGMKKSTLGNYSTSKYRIKKYRSSLDVNDINYTWLLKFEEFCRKEMELDVNSIYRTMILIRSVIKKAIKEGYFKAPNPFESYIPKRIERRQNFLTENELQQLTKLLNSGVLRKVHVNVLTQFLFSAYTGLSFADMSKLKYDNILFIENKYVILDNRSKVEESNFVVPILNEAECLIDLNNKTGVVFTAISNQKTNKYLKEILTFVGISRKITYHSSRHTCATLLINRGTPRHIVQKIMGHKKAATTDHYAKMNIHTIINTIKNHEQKN